MKQHELLHVIARLTDVTGEAPDRQLLIDICEEGGTERHAAWAALRYARRTGFALRCKDGHIHLSKQGAAQLADWTTRGTCGSYGQEDDCHLMAISGRGGQASKEEQVA